MKRISTLCIALLIGFSAFSQSSFLDLTIVESSNYNKTVGNFSYSNFENMFKITSPRGLLHEGNIKKALQIFIGILEPEKSYIIQHEPTYYFIFQYDAKTTRYLVMNNTIGEQNDAVFCDTFRKAQIEMMLLLETFYNNIPMVSLKEYE